MAAALVHLVAHAAFKSLGFLAAGSVLVATGLRDLDRLGGLARRMPATTVLFGVAALGASGLPLGAGFVSEWLLLQSLIHAAADHNAVVALTTPLAVGAVALTTGLGVAAMVKAFGIGFLARPRSESAADAHEAPPSMLVGMAVAAGACIALAVTPGFLAPALRRVLDGLPAARAVAFTDFGAFIRLARGVRVHRAGHPGRSADRRGTRRGRALLLARRASPARRSRCRCGPAGPTNSRRGCSTPRHRSPSRCSACSTTCCDRIPTSRSPRRRVAVHGGDGHLPRADRRRDRAAPLRPGDPRRLRPPPSSSAGRTPAASTSTWPTARSES